jgi:anhydro-N-acetylmuramic acid kinase
MSGTSLDGIDAAYVELTPRNGGYDVRSLRFATFPFPEGLRERLFAALPPHAPPLGEIVALDAALGEAFGAAARAVASDEPLGFVASHGLTLYHDGASQRTWQIGDPFAIRERAGATVAFDFRRADCAAGGQGAPLVPFVDALLFGSPDRTSVALNLGGIANVTVIPPGAHPEEIRGWDTGPGNMLIDALVRRRTRGSEQFDDGGRYARRGRVSGAAFAGLLSDSYFAQAPPKSTGRERFGEAFLDRRGGLADLSIEDGCATLTALTAETIARDLRAYGPAGGRIVASGGGARNVALLAALEARLAPAFQLVPSSDLGVDPDAKEAVAFAVLGYELLRGRAAGLPTVTGAQRRTLLGALAPYDLERLLTQIERETAGAGVRSERETVDAEVRSECETSNAEVPFERER